MISDPEQLARLVAIDAEPAVREAIIHQLAQSSALLAGHFALHRERHSRTALRFRGVARDAKFMDMVVDAVVTRAPADLLDELVGATILTPESSGFFLGRKLVARFGTRHVVAQTDLRRLPTKTLLSGAIQPNDRVVLVNDVASTGASLDLLRQLVVERGGLAVGVMLFAVVGRAEFERYCAVQRLPSCWLVTAQWETYVPAVCPACKSGDPLTPIAEFA